MRTDEALGRVHTPPRRGGVVSLVLALVVLFGVVLAAVWLFATPAPRTNTTPKGSGAVPGPAASTGAAGGCSLPEGSQAIPTDTPAGITWSLSDGWLLPTSPDAGPAQVVGPVPRCFARNPVGALLASIRLTDAALSRRPGEWLQVLRTAFYPGPGTDVAIASSMRVPGPSGALWVGPRTAQVAGFRFLAYSRDVAVLALLERSTDTGALSTGSVTVHWADGDWKVEPDPQGRVSGPQTVVPSLVGWVPFRGA